MSNICTNQDCPHNDGEPCPYASRCEWLKGMSIKTTICNASGRECTNCRKGECEHRGEGPLANDEFIGGEKYVGI